jgi:hypothetical protein
MQHAMSMRHIVICDMSGSTVFIHIISQTARISKKKKKVIEYKMCVFLVWKISHFNKNSARYLNILALEFYI